MSITLLTSHGDIKVELFCEHAPVACRNFLALCGSGYYNNTLFHRNIKNFIVQGGDPTGTGKGGESIYGKHFEDEFHPDLRHNTRGMLSMANSGSDKNGSQFFFTYKKASHLDDKFTVFGKVIYGFETLDIMERETNDDKDRPLNKIILHKAIIHANPIADKE